MKILTQEVAVMVDGKPAGIEHRGFIGFIPVAVCSMNNGTVGIRIGGNAIGLSPEFTQDLKKILDANSVSVPG